MDSGPPGMEQMAHRLKGQADGHQVDDHFLVEGALRPWNRFRQERSRASTVSVALPSLKPRALGSRVTGISTFSPRSPPGGKVRSSTTLLWSALGEGDLDLS